MSTWSSHPAMTKPREQASRGSDRESLSCIIAWSSSDPSLRGWGRCEGLSSFLQKNSARLVPYVTGMENPASSCVDPTSRSSPTGLQMSVSLRNCVNVGDSAKCHDIRLSAEPFEQISERTALFVCADAEVRLKGSQIDRNTGIVSIQQVDRVHLEVDARQLAERPIEEAIADRRRQHRPPGAEQR